MTTRREIIKSGLGLAAIIAAGKAPATIVRSMIGARNAMLSGGGGWTNPYVTDGLLRMWDGEWNVGGGVHDENAIGWLDLVNNELGEYNVYGETPAWGGNFWESKSYNENKCFFVTVPSLVEGNGSTIELVVEKVTNVRGVICGGYQITGGN